MERQKQILMQIGAADNLDWVGTLTYEDGSVHPFAGTTELLRLLVQEVGPEALRNI